MTAKVRGINREDGELMFALSTASSKALTIGSLFSGIGGLELGLERGIGDGCHTIWQVEQSEFCRSVLARHWPQVMRFEDVKHVGAHNLSPVDLVCGGFPCQDVSHANPKGQGLDGDRSGLWFQFARIIRELRPRIVVVENVAALVNDGLDRVLRPLAEIGYDAEWSVLSACAVGAPHTRERVFVVAHRTGLALENAKVVGLARGAPLESGRVWTAGDRPDATWSLHQRPVLGMAHGISDWVHRARSLGNSVVPQVAEVVGRLIAERENELRDVA